MRNLARSIALLVVFAGLLVARPLAAQTPPPIVQIVKIDTQQFPTLSVVLNYSTAQGLPVAGAPSFTVTVDGQPVDAVETQSDQRTIAVAIVADLSARMSDTGTAGVSRFDDMLPRVKELVDQLRNEGHFASLVTFGTQVTVPHSMTYDLGAVSNTLNRGNSALSFEPAPLDAKAADAPYPLLDALNAGLAQLDTAEASAPRALVLFAAGTPTSLEVTALRQRMEAQRTQKRPIRLLILGFGSDQPGKFTQAPAGPASLGQLATEVGGQFIDVGTTPLNTQTKGQIDNEFAAIRTLAKQYKLSFSASKIKTGKVLVSIAAGAAKDDIQFEPGQIPPRFNVVVDTRTFQDQVRLSVQITLQQDEIRRVEYLLNDLPLATSEQGPEFVVPINSYAPEFQQKFPPGEYKLTAAAVDVAGNQSRSEAAIPVTVFAPPPPPTLLEQATRYWWVGLIIVALAGLAIFGFTRRPAPVSRRVSKTSSAGVVRGEEPTVEHGAAPAYNETRAFQPGLTTEFKPAAPSGLTTEFHAQPSKTQRLRTRWFIEVVEGDADKGRRFEVHENRHINIGRTNPPDPPPDFALNSGLVSKGSHVRLSLLHNGIELVAGASRNGTFVGDEQREIPANTNYILKENDIFWLSRGVKLRVSQEEVL
ncbi:MAG: hypothetical protein WCG26_00060 [Chloroflexales bacterium]